MRVICFKVEKTNLYRLFYLKRLTFAGKIGIIERLKRGAMRTLPHVAPQYFADMAQEVEHVLGKDEVTSSNLVISSRKNVPYNGGRFFWSWGASPSKSTPNKEECFFLSLCFISLKNIPYNGGRFFWSRGASPSKALQTKRSAFFFRCVSSPSKTSLTTRDVFLGAGASPSKSTPNKEECFFLSL